MSDAVLVVVVFALVVLGPLVLYYFVRAEHDNRETMNRREAEQTARRDTRDRK